MSSTEIKYYIDNRYKISEEIDRILESLSEEDAERIESLFEKATFDELYYTFRSIFPNTNLTKEAIKVMYYIESPNTEDKLFNNEEYTSIIKQIIDIYGNEISEIITIDHLKLNDLDFLLSLDNPKYLEAYKSILEKQLSSTSSMERVIKILQNTNTSVLSEDFITTIEDLIIKVIENNKYDMTSSEAKEILNAVPSSLLQDGLIVKTMVKRIEGIDGEDAEILDYIPPGAYDAELVNEIIERSFYGLVEVFKHIPQELKTREIWEKVINKYPSLVCELPIQNIDPSISQDEYTKWAEDLIVKNTSKGSRLYIFYELSDEKKTISLCQRLAESFPEKQAKELLEYIPENSKTLKLYETLVSKSPKLLRKVPLESFIPNVSQEEYDKWYENLISKIISNTEDMGLLVVAIPQEKINERIWNEWLDKCIQTKSTKRYLSLSKVALKNLTIQMIERALKEIDEQELFNVPCIDKKLDGYEDIIVEGYPDWKKPLSEEEKQEYESWQNSFSEEEKQKYRNLYEQSWIEFVKRYKVFGALHKCVPPEGITAAMKKACMDVSWDYINYMTKPQTPEELKEYQQWLIYAVKNGPSITEDFYKNIPIEYINEDVIREAIKKNPLYLHYVDPDSKNFDELANIAYKQNLEELGRTELTSEELRLIRKFAHNNAELFETLDIRLLNPIIVETIGESSLETIVRYENVQLYVLHVSNDERKLKLLGFALENLKKNNTFIEPLIEKLSYTISNQIISGYDFRKKERYFKSVFLDAVSQRIDRKDVPFTDYEKAIISYLALNPTEGKKIKSYDDILTFVKRKNNELETTINNPNTTILEVKNAYLERIFGLNYEDVVNLVTMYGNDPEELLKNYENINPESFQELAEKEALEIIIKLKSLIETQDIDAIRSELKRVIDQEREEESFLRYQESMILENTLRRAYGRDLVKNLPKEANLSQAQELDYDGEKYYVIKVEGNFNRMVSLLNAYNESTTTTGDMYDRWNTNQMANNHALCYSFINQSNPGTAMTHGKKGVIISINGFSPEALSAAGPYDLCSNSRENTTTTYRQQRFFSSKNVPNQTRFYYSEYVIEIRDVLSESDKYQKIQPATIICFEEVDEDSIKASIELSKKLGYPVPIELIDRRELAKDEMIQIEESLEKFKTSEDIDTTLVEDIITRFNNVRSAHRESNLSDELVGENSETINEDAPFNKKHLNQLLKECLDNIEQRICNGQVEEGLEALQSIKMIIQNEQQKAILCNAKYNKQRWAGIDISIHQTINKLQRTYGKQTIKPLTEIKTLNALPQMLGKDLSSVTFDATWGKVEIMPEQLSADQIIEYVDIEKIQKAIADIHSEGYYQDNKSYDEEHIARVILFSDVISKMEGFDEKTRELLTEVAKYYSCGRQLDIIENHGEYSAELAGQALENKYSQEDLHMIQASIELYTTLELFQPKSMNKLEQDEEKEMKIGEIFSKYGLSEEQATIVRNISSCINDSVKLDQARFVDKVEDREKDKEPGQSFNFREMELESSKKMIKLSYAMQDLLAQQELDRLSSVVQIDFNAETSQIIDKFFTIHKDSSISVIRDERMAESPIVRLEYLKIKHPEVFTRNEESLEESKHINSVLESSTQSEISQLKELKESLIDSEETREINEMLYPEESFQESSIKEEVSTKTYE